MRFMSIVAKLSFAAFVIALVVGLVASFGTRFHLWGFEIGLLKIFPWCLYAGLAAFGLGLLWVLTAAFTSSSVGAGYGVIGFLGAIAVLALPLYNIYMVKIAHAIPPIHDISTDTEFPPQFVALAHNRPGALNPPDYDGPKRLKLDDGTSATTSALQKKYYGDLRAVEQFTTPQKLFQRALTAAQAMGWDIVSVAPDKEGGRIEASDQTLFFGFTDDIVIRVRPSGIGARLDIRSKSRVGVSDLGKNASRIRAYMKKLAAT